MSRKTIPCRSWSTASISSEISVTRRGWWRQRHWKTRFLFGSTVIPTEINRSRLAIFNSLHGWHMANMTSVSSSREPPLTYMARSYQRNYLEEPDKSATPRLATCPFKRSPSFKQKEQKRPDLTSITKAMRFYFLLLANISFPFYPKNAILGKDNRAHWNFDLEWMKLKELSKGT